MAVGKEKKKSKINTWKPKKNQILVEPDGKLYVCHFDKIFGNSKLKGYNRFIINKSSYENKLGLITQYTNFFMNFYDPDDELALAYLKCKFTLDNEKRFNEENMDSFIEFIYEVMFTPSIINKIYQLVDDNYLDDIESDTEAKKKFLKNEKKHLESLEFTNQHVKALLRISFGMKLMSPVLFHYLSINVIKITKDSFIIFKFYQKLFDIFAYGDNFELCDESGEVIEENIPPETMKEILSNNDDIETVHVGAVTLYYRPDRTFYRHTKIEIYNKIYCYVKAKVLESNSNNTPIFEQREIFGSDVFTVINQFTKKILISESMVKYMFNENIIGFNKTVIKYQLMYFLKDQYETNLIEVTNAKNSDGLSGVDKMAMNLSKVDEGVVTMAEINISKTIDMIRKIIDVPITEEELDYYDKYADPSPIQIQLVNLYYTKFFGTYRDLTLLPRREYLTLSLILKKKLLIENGYEIDDQTKVRKATALPYILTGKLEDKVNTRIIRNNKFVSKIEESYLYQNLIQTKYKYLEQIRPKFIIQLLSSYINTKFSYITYENEELLGKEIKYSDDKIGDELLFFLYSI